MKVLREALATLGLLYAVSVVALHYGAMPQRIPTHFNASGVIDGWGDKSALWLPVGVALALYGMLTLVSFVSESAISLPVRSESRSTAVPVAMEMLGWLKVETIWIAAVLCAMMVRVGTGQAHGLGLWFVPVELSVVFGTAGFYLWRMTRTEK